MFIVWIITNLRNKKEEKVKANKSFWLRWMRALSVSFTLVTLKLNLFYCFLYLRLCCSFSGFCCLWWPFATLSRWWQTLWKVSALFINSVTITRKVKNKRLMNKVFPSSLPVSAMNKQRKKLRINPFLSASNKKGEKLSLKVPSYSFFLSTS